MESKLYVSSSPHLRSGDSTKRIMGDVIIALIPAMLASGIIFGPRALLVILVTVASCVASEYIARRILKRSNTIGDLSAVVTGILLAFNLPVGINLFMAAFGGIAPSYHIELLDKPTIYWDFHSLLLGIQMMFSFMLVDGEKPLRLCKHCQKVFLSSRSNSAFCSPRCKNQYNVYKSRGKKTSEED